MDIRIYTDGGCSGNPGPGGWAYIIVGDTGTGASVLAERRGAEGATTNNRMELNAAAEALRALPLLKLAPGRITVYTDSQYVQKGMSVWIHDWKRNAWRTSAGDPVKNQDLWKCLEELSSGLPLRWEWVKGHAGNEFNERCDRMTREAIDSLA
jgi:ribonuclease HI